MIDPEGREATDRIDAEPAVLPGTRPWRARLAAGLVILLIGLLLLGGLLLREKASSSKAVVGPDVPATAINQLFSTANNSPQLAVDPTEPRFVVLANRLDGPDFSCALQISGDAGESWIPASPVPTLPSGAEKCYGPEVGFDARGVLYYLFVGLAGEGNRPMGAFLTTSSDRAQTFSEPRQVLGPLNFGIRMALDARGKAGKDRLYLTWIRTTSDISTGAFGVPPNPIMVSYSDDGGTTFSKAVQVSSPNRQRVVAPALFVGANHQVHIAYYDLKDDARDYFNLEGPVWNGTWALILSSSNDGFTFEDAVVSDEIVPPERPILILTMAPPGLVADRTKACLAWTDARFGDADVLFACGRAGRGLWPPIRINDDEAGNGVTQYLPRLGLSGDGRIDAVFYDRRDDPENNLNRAYFTTSIDHGRSFGKNLRVSTAGSSSLIGPQYVGNAAMGQNEIGSRLGVLSRRKDILASWGDARHSRLLRGEQGQDVYVAKISGTPASMSWPGLPAIGGVVLLVAGVLVMISASLSRRHIGEVRGFE